MTDPTGRDTGQGMRHIEEQPDLVLDYLDGRLGDEDMTSLLLHLESCEACRASLDEQREVAALLTGVALVEPPRRIEHNVFRVERQTPLESIRRRLTLRTWLPAAALLVAGVAAVATYRDVLPPQESAIMADAEPGKEADGTSRATDNVGEAAGSEMGSATLPADGGTDTGGTDSPTTALTFARGEGVLTTALDALPVGDGGGLPVVVLSLPHGDPATPDGPSVMRITGLTEADAIRFDPSGLAGGSVFATRVARAEVERLVTLLGHPNWQVFASSQWSDQRPTDLPAALGDDAGIVPLVAAGPEGFRKTNTTPADGAQVLVIIQFGP